MIYELDLDKNGNLLLYTRGVGIKKLNRLQAIKFYIDKLNGSIRNVVVASNDTSVILKYDGYTVVVHNADQTVKFIGIRLVSNKIKKFLEGKIHNQPINKKVSRVNKYSGAKIISNAVVSIGLSAVVAFAGLTMDDFITVVDSDIDSADFIKYEETISDETDELGDLEFQDSLIGDENLDKEDVKENDSLSIFIDYFDQSDSERANNTRENYGDLIKKYSLMYGVDPNIMLGIATQERGIHSSERDACGALGLMQIEYNIWVNQTISAYNFNTNEMEEFKITPENMSDLETNIKIACMIFQNNLKDMNYNVIAALQCYNMGVGNMNALLKTYAFYSGKTCDEILNDCQDTGWLSYRQFINQGDKEYVEKVLSWIGKDVGFRVIKIDGTIINTEVNNNIVQKIH